MDAKETLAGIKSQLDADEAELKQLDILIRVAKKAGESVADLERNQTAIRNRIKMWRDAIKSEGF